MPVSSSSRHVLLLVAATACWGCGTVLSKQVLDRGVGPVTLLVVELIASCFLLALATLLTGVRMSWSPAMAKLAALGLLNPGLAYTLGLLGLVSITASMSVLLWATEPVLIILLAVVVLRERIVPATLLAVTAALVGVVLVVYRPGVAGHAVGVGLTVAAVAACATYAVLTRRLILDDTSLAVALVQQIAALCFALAVLCVVVITGVAELALPGDIATWALATASGITYYGFAFWFFVGGLRGVPISVAGTFLPLIPVFGLAAGYVGGDRLSVQQWLGAALVVMAAAATAVRHLRSTARASEETAAASRADGSTGDVVRG